MAVGNSYNNILLPLFAFLNGVFRDAPQHWTPYATRQNWLFSRCTPLWDGYAILDPNLHSGHELFFTEKNY